MIARKFHTSTYSLIQSRLFCRQFLSAQKYAPERTNPLGIQMLSEAMFRQLFKGSANKRYTEVVKEQIQSHLKQHGLLNKTVGVLPEVSFKLPEMKGEDLEQHINNITLQQAAPYIKLADRLNGFDIPVQPKEWKHAAGWYRYSRDGTVQRVDYPDEDVFVFDVETLVNGNYPVMATAVSDQAWYSWCSERLIDDKFIYSLRPPRHADLIPMESSADSHPQDVQWSPKFVLGHNVSFDRSYMREQYFIKGSKMKFFDTMSMHIAISGFSSFQRLLYNAHKAGKDLGDLKEKKNPRAYKPRSAFSDAEDFQWMQSGTVNNLDDVYQFHCKDALPLDKASRDVFVNGSIKDINAQFQNLMTYCSQDVVATLKVYQKLWPNFRRHFPSPVTFAGMLELSTAYLPVNNNWNRYLEVSDQTYYDNQNDISNSLSRLAAEVCSKYSDSDNYKSDPWVYNLNWTAPDMKLLKLPRKGTKVVGDINGDLPPDVHPVMKKVLESANRLPLKKTHMPGVPRWYSNLHPKQNDKDWKPGPSLLTTGLRITPKLLKLRWEGYPLYHHKKYGWGYFVPDQEDPDHDYEVDFEEMTEIPYPYKTAREMAYTTPPEAYSECRDTQLDRSDMSKLIDTTLEKDSMTYSQSENIWSKIRVMSQHQQRLFFTKYRNRDGVESPSWHQGIGPVKDVKIPGGWFFKLPHKNGDNNNVGNPLSKEFLTHVSSGMLTSAAGSEAVRVLNLNIQSSYWKNARDRIRQQMVMWLDHDKLPENISDNDSFNPDGVYGAILPRIITAGTVTRRAVEKTWLTASNAKVDRIGSELKAMIQSPPGYHFVGADVDSQELWIASLLGDAHFAGMHGCTAIGWMTLQGNKAEGTDLHSKTASLIGISRDEAKIFNYGRIYGAGKLFARKLLLQFNHRMTEEEAKEKANVMYSATKGTRKSVQIGKSYGESGSREKKWIGGSESEMFNWLESMAVSQDPRTPVLRCKITKALLPQNVHDGFMTSRINWVVQSSAVDYLHLMLVCMRWLMDEFNIDGRFCISIHDEVRYLVKSEDRYRAALALQITNLYTRAMFAHKIGINDLPQNKHEKKEQHALGLTLSPVLFLAIELSLKKANITWRFDHLGNMALKTSKNNINKSTSQVEPAR